MSYDAAYHQAYYLSNRERIVAKRRQWAKEHPEAVKHWGRNRKKPNQAKARLAGYAWEQRNPEKILFRSARNRARRDGLEFSITIADIEIPELCPLLELPIQPRRGGRGPMDQSPSLDRIDNKLGYVPGNVWVISWLANKMKATASREQLETFAQNVLNRFRKGG